MTRNYEFDHREDGIVARRVDDPDVTVEFDSRWAETDGPDGEWLRVVRAVVSEDPGAIAFEDGDGTVDRQRATEILSTASDDDGALVEGRPEAAALIELLETAGAIGVDDDRVLLFRDPRDAGGEADRILLNWATAVETCAERIERIMDRTERSATALAERDGAAHDDRRTVSAERLADGIETLEVLRTVLEEEARRLRTAAIAGGPLPDRTSEVAAALERLFDRIAALDCDGEPSPEAALEFVDDTGDLATRLSGVGGTDTSIEETTGEELAAVVDDVLGDIETVAEPDQE